MFRFDRFFLWVLVGVVALPLCASANAIPTAARSCGRALQVRPQVTPVIGMPEWVVKNVLNEEAAWQGAWPGSMGQYYATYARAGLTVYYSAEGCVVRVESLWPTDATRSILGRIVPGYVVVPGEGDW